jgi:hypothetical protein
LLPLIAKEVAHASIIVSYAGAVERVTTVQRDEKQQGKGGLPE